MRLTRTAILVVAGVGVAISAGGKPKKSAGTGADTIGIDQLMTANEFRTAGLTKLTPDELRALSGWLQRYTVTIFQAGASPQIGTTSTVVESRIDGEFEGWKGDTIFKLENGQIWQQASYAYAYHYAYRPNVVIFESGGGYKLKVEGMLNDALKVKRLK